MLLPASEHRVEVTRHLVWDRGHRVGATRGRRTADATAGEFVQPTVTVRVRLHRSGLALRHIEVVGYAVLRRVVRVDEATVCVSALEATHVEGVCHLVQSAVKLLCALYVRASLDLNRRGRRFVLNLFEFRSLNLSFHCSHLTSFIACTYTLINLSVVLLSQPV